MPPRPPQDPSQLQHHGGDVPTPPPLARRLAQGLGPEAAGGPWLDPACGDGALLDAALEIHGGDPRVLCFGIDTDPRKLARARERLARRSGHTEWELAGNFTLADALDPTTAWAPGTHLLANPPWVSFSGRHAAPHSTDAPGHHRGPGGWPALHAAFLARAARHLEQHGTQGRFLLPAPLAELSGYAALRREVEAHAHLITSPEALADDAFPGVHEPALLLHLGPGSSPASAPWSSPTQTPDEAGALLAALAGHPRVPAGTFADAGLHTGNCAELLVHDTAGPDRAPLRVGRDLAAFALAPATRFLDTQLPAGDGRRFRRKAVDAYRAFPVLLRQTADRPIAALHEPAEAFRNSLLAARPIPGLDAPVLVAVLNHPITARVHRARFADARQRRFPQVKIGHLAGLALPFAERTDDPQRHDEIARRVRALDPGSASGARDLQQLEELVGAAFGVPRELW